jgi:hypothetical protein
MWQRHSQDAELYPRLKDLKTSLSVSLPQCIKPGIDCPGHELVKVAGVYAGDEECYEVASHLLPALLLLRHVTGPKIYMDLC